MTPAEEHAALTEALAGQRAGLDLRFHDEAEHRLAAILDVLIEELPRHVPQQFDTGPDLKRCFEHGPRVLLWNICPVVRVVRAAVGSASSE